jgi:hypothetical protein
MEKYTLIAQKELISPSSNYNNSTRNQSINTTSRIHDYKPNQSVSSFRITAAETSYSKEKMNMKSKPVYSTSPSKK